jgi:hypothetical protein
MAHQKRRTATWRAVLYSTVASLLVPALFATGCARTQRTPDAEASDGGIGYRASALTTPGQDLQELADRLAFDPDYVAFQLKTIDVFGTILPHGAALAEEDLAGLDELSEDELQALTTVTDADIDELRSLGATVRTRFPWISSHGMDLHRLAVCTNPRLFSALEAALRPVPEFRGMTEIPMDPRVRREAVHAFALARVSGETSTSSADAGVGTDPVPPAKRTPPLFYAIMAVVMTVALVSLLTGHPEIVAGMLIAVALFIIGMILWDMIKYIVEWTVNAVNAIVQWVKDLPETLDENFGHDDDECSDDGDCDSDEYCDNGDLLFGIFGTNTCKPDHEEGDGCWQDSECETNCCKVYWLTLQCRPSSKCD